MWQCQLCFGQSPCQLCCGQSQANYLFFPSFWCFHLEALVSPALLQWFYPLEIFWKGENKPLFSPWCSTNSILPVWSFPLIPSTLQSTWLLTAPWKEKQNLFPKFEIKLWSFLKRRKNRTLFVLLPSVGTPAVLSPCGQAVQWVSCTPSPLVLTLIPFCVFISFRILFLTVTQPKQSGMNKHSHDKILSL